ncbi:hypothetical protein [Cryobacterium sp. TMT2-23]|uniref:hypothetical protein n=1 Tax=Cryobacterium sp. TMT2-23 TaxID=1259252 RepID=UPI00106DA19D|nr:hypothetical protein [Cryobacterium sp. TMT2-23]TFD17466.1 hypothetical protein E3T32_13900 [Cryobacterium sp. TMT2-23]
MPLDEVPGDEEPKARASNSRASKDEAPAEDGMDWLASQLGGGARPGTPDEFTPRRSIQIPRWPKPGQAAEPAPPVPSVDAHPKTAGFLWGLKPTTQTDPRLKSVRPVPAAAVPAADPPVAVPAADPPAGSEPFRPGHPGPSTDAASSPPRLADLAPAPLVPAYLAPAPNAPAPARAATPAASVPADPTPDRSVDPDSGLAPAVPTGSGSAVPSGTRIIRSQADLEPAPWWTTLTQSPLVPTAEETAAADLIAGVTRTPAAPAAPAPLEASDALPAPVSARSRFRAWSAAAGTAASAATAAATAAASAAVASVAASASPGSYAGGAAGAGGAAVTGAAAPNGTAPGAAEAAGPEAWPGNATPVITTAPAVAPPLPAGGARATTPAEPSEASVALTTTSAGTHALPAAAHADPGGRPPTGSTASRGGSARPPIDIKKSLPWIIAGVILVVVLGAFFFIGQSLGGDPTPVAAPTMSAGSTPMATPTPTPTPTPEVTGPQPAGVHQWNTLFGGECLEPYVSPWEEEFTVSDCGAPHSAQLVYRGVFAGDDTTAFPGEAELAGQINVLCSTPGVIDLAAAGAFPDLQVQGSYPITELQWTGGPRSYYCFVSRSSGKPLTVSLAGPGPAPAA